MVFMLDLQPIYQIFYVICGSVPFMPSLHFSDWHDNSSNYIPLIKCVHARRGGGGVGGRWGLTNFV